MSKIEPKLNLKGLERTELLKLLSEKRNLYMREQLKLKVNKSEHKSLPGKIRKNIARILTVLNSAN